MPDGNGNGQKREKSDRELRIDELKLRAQEAAEGEMTTWEAEDCPSDVAEQFWESVVAYETAPMTTHFKRLEAAGVKLPAPETMDEEELTSKLWEAIRKLAELRVFLSCTNHLSDRELYTLLWSDVLHEETPDLSYDEYSAWHLDLVSSGSEEDTYLYLKHYADEEWRQQWLADFPDYEMPEHEDPPYDRDWLLPQVNYAAPPESGNDEEV
jgi:hypothetical protein